MIKKEIKQLKVGESFKLEIPNPKGYLILKIQSIESDTNIPWCLVTKHHYDEPAVDEFDEEDRYKTGDTLPHIYGGLVEVIQKN